MEGYRIDPKSSEFKTELRRRLTPLQYTVTQEKGTERAFTNKYYKWKENGVYGCVVCAKDLFLSDTKYDTGSGWPAFYDVIDDNRVKFTRDASHGLVRTEVSCSNCGAHLGHLFSDGPKPTGKRYCINSASLSFRASDPTVCSPNEPKPEDVSYQADGCTLGITGCGPLSCPDQMSSATKINGTA